MFEFSSEFEIVECGVQIWKDESESNNTGKHQTTYSKPGSGEQEDVINNQHDTYKAYKEMKHIIQGYEYAMCLKKTQDFSK